METIPTLSDSEIEQRVGAKALRRGWEYFQRGALRQLCREGKTIRALCRGTGFEPYRVRVVFNERGIAEADCTCPIGQGGYCKHVAALLVAWRESPREFQQIEPLSTILARCTRRELSELIEKLLGLHPEMEDAIRTWAGRLGADRTPPDLADYRSQVKALLQQAARTDPPDWERVAKRLLVLQEIAEAFAHQRESENASVVYRAMLEEILADPQSREILSGPLRKIVDGCVEGLDRVLADRDVAPDVRTGILRILLALLRLHLEIFGSLRKDVVEVFRRQTTPTEKSLLSQWIESLAGRSDSQATQRLLGGVLLELGGQEMDFDSFARICRSTGRYFDLCRRLVLWGRVPEALQEADHLPEDELRQLADLLAVVGHSAQAEHLLRQRLAGRQEGPLADWLAHHQQTQQKQKKRLELAEQIFRLEPRFEAFLELRRAARSVGQWDQLRSKLLADLESDGQWEVLVRILLEEKELARALALLESHPGEALQTWEMEIAQAAERLYPAEALVIYRRRVERLVGQRSRHHYAEACRVLRKIRSLMKRSGAGQEWPAYLADFRSRYQGLPALQEELTKIGL